MKKFLFLYYGFVTPTEEIGAAWGKWFEAVGDKFVDTGNPFGYGREITKSGTKELTLDLEALTGYSIINAADIDEAEKIAKTCPIITSIRIYEADSM
ncbi:MAG: hypothetical protein IIA59_00720 [Candidatus Marinimicrobia bacterium]|nr:hypothetical protein [Candidatus Neomarinimicrobiota bacterium]